MLRSEDYLDWKPESEVNKFQILVVSSQDRILGKMVEAQRAEDKKKREAEYRKRKAAEKKKIEDRDQEEKENPKDGKDGKDGKNEDEGKERRDSSKHKDTGVGKPKEDTEKVIGNAAPESKADDKKTGAKGIVINGVKVYVVEEGKQHPAMEDGKVIHAQAAALAQEVLVVPVNQGLQPKDKDGQHDAEPVAVGVKKVDVDGAAGPDGRQARSEQLLTVDEAKKERSPEAQRDGVEIKATPVVEKTHEKPKDITQAKHVEKHYDPLREAEKLAQMMAGEGPINMEDIKVAFRALEKVAGESSSKPKTPMIWTWYEPVERWRWLNYEAGLHNVGPGGWEERDWKVFADDRGCDDFDEDEEWEETLEEDLHDWSC